MTRRDSATVDLDADSRRALEFDDLLDWVAAFARTPLGAERIRAHRPSADLEAIRNELRAVDETRKYIAADGNLLPHALPDPTAAIEALAVADLRLTPTLLRDLASLGSAAADLRGRLIESGEALFPLLCELGNQLPDLREPCAAVLDGIGPDGRIEDSASSELRRIRRAIGRVGKRLRELLHGILRDPDSEAVIQDDFITERNGRFVIPVRTDAPRPFEGIVHARSSSGATRFVEPIATVEPNNELVRLAEEEREEQDRVLALWSESFRRRLPEVQAMVRVVTRLDDLQARALFAERTRAVSATLGPGAALRLVGARHPLLDRHLSEAGQPIVPLSVTLDPADQVLVISGPNTGGKTVALKTLGLTVLMSQSGIPVPADGLELPVFNQVRADIGDHQSISADLSTYSAHIGAVVGYLKQPARPALYLFDEIGTGTEPTEGAALARAILENLAGPGITAVVTTHLGPLKTWAIERDGVACAAMEFDADSLQPTFRALMGVAGSSAGLEIAERLGLDPAIVERGRELLDPRSRQSERYLTRLRELVAETERQRGALGDRMLVLEEERQAQARRFEKKLDQSRRDASKRLDGALQEIRELGRRELKLLGEQGERGRLERRWSKSESRIGAVHAALRSELGRSEDDSVEWIPVAEVREGMQVRVKSLGKDGEVVGVDADRVEVRLGGMTLTVNPLELATRKGADPSIEPRSSRPQRPPSGAAHFESRQTVPRELKLIGQSVEEAQTNLERFLDGALVAGHDEVRIVHGHGTGRLKTAVRQALDRHPEVESYRPGGRSEGGDGATVARFR